MATVREYAYYLKGNRISLVEKDTSFDNDTSSRNYGPGVNKSQWKSPLTTIASGLELEYTYAPWWRVNSTSYKDNQINYYKSDDGYLAIIDNSDSYTNYADYSKVNNDTTVGEGASQYTHQAIATGEYIVLENAQEFNGAHRVRSISDYGSGTNNMITLDTQYNGSTNIVQFDETGEFKRNPTLYYNVMTLFDDPIDDMHIPVTDYQADAIVYYVKAKLSEDRQDFEKYEYFMSKFKKMIEQNESAKIWGARMIASGPNAIR